MKKLRKLSLKEELEKEAAEIEKELAEDPELDNLEVSKELDDAIYAEIQRYEKEQEEDKIKEFPLRTYKKKSQADCRIGSDTRAGYGDECVQCGK